MHTVQHLQFTFPTIPEKLFYTTSGGDHACQVKEDGLHLTAYGRQVSLNLTSLFNSFPAEHFLTNTRARLAYLQLRFSGRADSISVYRKTQWNDETVHRQLDPAAGEILLGPFPLEKKHQALRLLHRNPRRHHPACRLLAGGCRTARQKRGRLHHHLQKRTLRHRQRRRPACLPAACRHELPHHRGR